MRNVLASAAVLLAMTSGPSMGIQAQQIQTSHLPILTFSAELRGGNEVPPVITAAFGTAELVLDQNIGCVDCTVNVWNAPSVVASHIHLGDAGVSGPVVIGLSPPAFTGDGSWECDFDLADVIAQPSRGLVTSTDLEQIFMGNGGRNLYVNVHTTENGSGEIRGQLSAR